MRLIKQIVLTSTVPLFITYSIHCDALLTDTNLPKQYLYCPEL